MQIIRRDSLCLKLGGISAVSLWRLTRDDPSFPSSITINKRVVGWFEHEINQWLEARAASRPLISVPTQNNGVSKNE
jgi:prophage regulatory protein